MLRTALGAVSVGVLTVASCQSSSGPPAPTSTPCGDYYDALDDSPCSTGPTLPASEVARLRGRFQQVCQSGLALPGSGLNDETLEACASAVNGAGCAAGAAVPAVCDITGALPAGAACNENFQCQSGACFQVVIPGEGGASSDACATCLPIAQLGQPCTVACPPGATCDHRLATPTCVTVMHGMAGAKCDGQALQCTTGLYCDNSATCAPMPAAGQPCTPGGLCAAPAACVGAVCELAGATGATCEQDFTCAAGLGCSLSQTCGAVTWAGAGQPCGDLVRCLVGDCNGGTCPAVIADGSACTVGDLSSTCDTFAQCQGGTCVRQDSQVCR